MLMYVEGECDDRVVNSMKFWIKMVGSPSVSLKVRDTITWHPRVGHW